MSLPFGLAVRAPLGTDWSSRRPSLRRIRYTDPRVKFAAPNVRYIYPQETVSGMPGHPSRKHLFAYACLLALTAAANAGITPSGAAAADPYSHEAIAAKNYRGVTLNILTLATPVLGEPVVLHAREFERLTGARIKVTRVPFSELYQETLLGLRQNKYDALTFGSMWIADMVPFLEPLPARMLESEQYLDVLPHYKRVASWGDMAYMVPIDGDRHYLQYRRDLLENPDYRAGFKRTTGKELQVPRTWPELQEIARFFQGRKLPDGSLISGLAEVTVNDALLGNYFIKRAAPYAKHPAVKGGFYFDLKTMDPLIKIGRAHV